MKNWMSDFFCLLRVALSKHLIWNLSWLSFPQTNKKWNDKIYSGVWKVQNKKKKKIDTIPDGAF